MRALNVDDMATAQILRERLQTIDAAIQEIQVRFIYRLPSLESDSAGKWIRLKSLHLPVRNTVSQVIFNRSNAMTRMQVMKWFGGLLETQTLSQLLMGTCKGIGNTSAARVILQRLWSHDGKPCRSSRSRTVERLLRRARGKKTTLLPASDYEALCKMPSWPKGASSFI